MVDVLCNGCTACCRNPHPGLGAYLRDYEDFRKYKTVWNISPITGQMGRMIEKKSDGSCVYLVDKGCDIYSDRPDTCKEFDCRKFAFVPDDVIAAGRERS